MGKEVDGVVHYGLESKFGFKYRELKIDLTVEQQREQVNTLTHNAIFFQLEGELLISWEQHKDVHVRPGELYFLPRGANVSACAVGWVADANGYPTLSFLD